jgi:tRNA-2-methylthio-N6-dimethylallyladenosine synthase
VVIGVGGCVASQEGEAIVKRAPYVDLVFGPQTLHRLPELIRAKRETGLPQVDISFPEIEKFDRLPEPRADGPSAFVSIMEGCSKYCSFCVVPYTRGEEISRPFEDVLVEVADLAARACARSTCSARTSMPTVARSWRRRRRAIADLGLLIRAIAEIEASAASASPPRTRWSSPTRWSRPTATCPSSPTTCTCRCRPAATACSRR